MSYFDQEKNIIHVRTTRDVRVGSHILSASQFLECNNVANSETVFDFSRYGYSPPFLSVFFSNFIAKIDKARVILPEHESYLNYIHFPDGFCNIDNPSWQTELERYRGKTYVPILVLSNKKDKIHEQNSFISLFNDLVTNVTIMPSNYRLALSYLISEIMDNINEHSLSETCRVGFQYYKDAGVIDICIGDSGIGLLKSYQNYKGTKDFSMIKTHADAVKSVFEGQSTKEQELRGFGLRTARKLLIEGIKGKFFLMSGNSVVYNHEEIPFEVDFQGVSAVFRIPVCNFDTNLSIYQYVE